jgi:hypothetical protein
MEDKEEQTKRDALRELSEADRAYRSAYRRLTSRAGLKSTPRYLFEELAAVTKRLSTATKRLHGHSREEPAEAQAVARRVALETLHPELSSRILAATAHAEPRVIHRRESVAEAGIEEYEVHALAGDRVVQMVLSLRPDGSVAETTETFLQGEIADLVIETDHATIEVDGPSGRQAIAVPVELARALKTKASPERESPK